MDSQRLTDVKYITYQVLTAILNFIVDIHRVSPELIFLWPLMLGLHDCTVEMFWFGSLKCKLRENSVWNTSFIKSVFVEGLVAHFVQPNLSHSL